MTIAREVAEALRMLPHPEGGWYAETWRAPGADGQRPPGSAILYLLAAGEALELLTWSPGDPTVTGHRLGPAVGAGDATQAVVPAGAWQTARPLGAWALVGCIVAPAFEFAGWELAPEGWEPPI